MNKKIFVYLRLAGYVLIPLILFLLPATYFDTGKPKCISVLLFDQECYGCGMTRSIMHLIHFDLASSLYYHNLGWLVFLLLAYVWVRWFWRDLQRL